MNKTLIWVAALALLICGTHTATAQGRPDQVALFVNDEPISTWEIGLLLPQIQSGMASQGLDPKGEAVLNTALQRAVDNKLLTQEARRRGIEPDAARIQQRMDAMADRAGGRAALEAELIKSGVMYSQLRETVVQADLVQSLVETEVGEDGAITDEDVAAFYAENSQLFKSPDSIHTRHILLKVEADASPAQREAIRERASVARERALAGEDFAALARELSEGPNAQRGGDLGFTTRGQMVERFDEAVWALDAGEISGVVESRLGYHVIKVEEIAIGPTVPLDEARPTIENLLRQQTTGQALSGLVSELRASAVIRDPEL